MTAKLPGLQPVRTGDPAQDRFLEAVRERLEVREGSRGDPLEAVVLQRDLLELGLKKQGRVALPDGKPGFVTQIADGSYVSISADELVSRLEGTDWYRSLSASPGGVTDSTRQSILSAITEEISKRSAEDRRLDAVIAGIRDELLRKIGDLASKVPGASAASPTPNNYDTFTVTLLSDNTRVFTFAYTTTTPPVDLAGAVIRFKKGATGTELWGAMSPLHDGVLTNSPTETRAGDPDVYRFALKARSRSGIESSDATVRYVDITLPALSEPAGLSISADSMIFIEDATGTLTNPTITLTAVLAGTLAGGTVTWSHSTGYGGSTPTGTNTWAVSGASQTADQVTYTASITVGATTYTDSVVLYKMRQGAEQIIVLLTNPVMSVPATSAGVVTTFTAQTTELQVYYGGSLASDSLLTYTVASDPSGTGLTVASTGVYTLTFPGSPSGWWTSSAPSANVVLRAALVSDPTAYRDITLVITKNLMGADGSPANDIQLNASVLTFSFDTAGTAYPAAQSSVLSVTRVPGSLAGTVSWSATAYTSSGVQVGSTGGVGLSGSGDSRTLTTGNFMAPGGSFDNTIQYVTVTATLGALSRSIRITRTTDGQEAIISFLTNPTVSLPASSAGVVSSWAAATGDFQVWQGGVEVTSGITYAIQSNPSTLTASINSSTGVYSVTAAGSWANGSNTTSITFRATHTASGATRDAVFTLTKSLAGTDGGAGTPGADAVVYEIEPTPSTVSRNNIGVATPSAVTFYAYSKTGSAARAAFSGRFILRTTTDGTTWTGVYTSPSNESSTAFTITSGITAVRAELYANTSFTPLLQQVTVPVVRDGMRAPMSLNSNSSSTAVYGTVSGGAVVWADAKGNEVVWRKLGYTSAPSATPGDYLIRGDLVTLFGELAHTSTPITRWWDGSAWVDPGTVIDGNLLVRGTVTLDAIKSGSTIGTSNVSFGLGVSWGPGSKVSGGYFHSTALDQFALVSDNVAGGYSIVSATTATDDAGAAFAGGGGWTGYTTSGGVTTGGTYATTGFIATGTAGGIFRYGSTTEALLGKSTAAGIFTQGSYVGTLGASSYAAEFKYGTTTNAKFGNTATAGTFSQGTYYATMSSASYAGYFDYNNTFRAKLGTSSYAGRFGAGTAGADTRAVSLADGSYAVNIEAGTLRYQSVTINAPPNDTDYLNGDGTWKHMYLDGSSGVTSNFTGSRPSGTTTNNIWISFYVGSTRLWIPAWYADS